MPSASARNVGNVHPFSGKRIEAVLFDLDGTLVDSAPDIAGAINVVLASQGLNELETQAVRGLIGEGIRRLTEKAFATRGRTLSDADLDKLTNAFAEEYASRIAVQTKPLPGVEQALTEFERSEFKMAVVSNKAQALTERLLQQLKLSKFFGHIQGLDAKLRPKPAPDMLLATLAALGHAADTAVFVGDTVIDVAAGNAAGLPVFLIASDYGSQGTPTGGAYQNFRDFVQFQQWLMGRTPW